MLRNLVAESLEQRQLLAVSTFQFAEQKSAGLGLDLPDASSMRGKLPTFLWT